MAQNLIDTTTNNGTYIGDPAKTAFEKANSNFTELYSTTVKVTGDQVISGNKLFSDMIRLGPGGGGLPTEVVSLYNNSGGNNSISTVLGVHSDRSNILSAIGVSRGGSSGLIGIAFATSSGASPIYRWEINPAGNLLPISDNSFTVGAAGRRPSVLWAASGTISTSDATKKTEVSKFSPNELECALALADEIGWFKWLDSVEEKGGLARKHVGQTVQGAIEVMQSYGVDPFEWGFICYDEWGDESCSNDDGEIIRLQVAGRLYSFRMDQLYAFIIAGIRFNQKSIEHRISVIESSMQA